MNSHFKLPPIRSPKILDFAKGQPCCFRFPGVCNRDPETTVACHIRDQHKGMGQKASDISIVFGCSDCHAVYDGQKPWPHPISNEDILKTVLRGMQETLELLIHGGVIALPEKKKRAKRVETSSLGLKDESAAKREKSKNNGAVATNWPKREFKSRNDLRRKAKT